MPVPWFQIVQLVPSIVEVSRELLRRTKSTPPTPGEDAPQSTSELAKRVAALEENERRQAELISQMAEQMAALTRAVTALHRQTLWLMLGLGATLVVALVAIANALR